MTSQLSTVFSCLLLFSVIGKTMSRTLHSHLPPQCAESQFHCLSSQECVPASWRCDRQPDCDSGEDELDCVVSATCPDGEFMCSPDDCIPLAWRCDGDADCFDANDEQHCEAYLESKSEAQQEQDEPGQQASHGSQHHGSQHHGNQHHGNQHHGNQHHGN